MSIKKNNKPKVEIKEIKREDLCKIAKVHIDSFPESALTKLGSAIVERYYLWQLIGPHKNVKSVGAFVDNNCAGFSFSGVFDGSTSGFLHENRGFLVKQVLLHPWLITNPLFFRRMLYGIKVLKSFSKKKKASNETRAAKALPYGILSIAVSNKYQNLGIGKILMNIAETDAVECGFDQIELTVSPDNLKAVKFYEKLNWQKVPAGNNWKGYMVKPLK